MRRAALMGRGRVDLTQGPVFSNLLTFSIPILLGTIVTQLYNVTDSVIVGQFVGADALAAVSASSPVMSLINMFMIGLSTGSTVVIAQRVGAKNVQALQKAIGTIACLTLLCSLFITVVGLLVSKPLLVALGTPEAIFGDSLAYLIVIYLGTTGNMIYQMGSGALRGMGDSSWPFLFLLLCSGLNVVLDLIAVLVLHMGVMGVAIATAISQLVSGIGIIHRINAGEYGVRLSLPMLRMDARETRQVVGIGLPAALGAKLGVPDREVVCVMGDGGFQVTMQELGTIMQNRIGVKMIVLNNSYLGMVRQWQQLFFGKRYSFTHIESPDLTLIAAAYGIPNRRVTEPGQLREAIEELAAAPGAYLLEVAVLPEENVFPMVPAGASLSDIICTD